MKALIALIVLLTITSLQTDPALARERSFAEYWVPQSDGERIFAYYVGKRAIAPGRFKVRYRSVDVDHGKRSQRMETAMVDCPGKRIDRIEINEADADASMATIIEQNLWWLVCRGVPEKYRPLKDQSAVSVAFSGRDA